MTYSVKSLTFKEPTQDEVALTNSLAATILSFDKKRRDSLFHLCMIAYGLRKHNLIKSTGRGGNAQGQTYKHAFLGWYEKHNLANVYGTLINFTLYAMSGRLLNYVRWQVDEKYITHLPSSLGALYACSQIIWSQGDSATIKSRKRFDDALKKPIMDGSKNNALIHPQVTRKELDSISQPTNKMVAIKSISALAVNDPRTIVMGSINVTNELYKFSKRGGKVGGIDLDDVQALEIALNKVVESFNKKKEKFVFISNLEEIKKAYSAHKSPDYSKHILGSKPKKLVKKKI